MNSRVVVHRLAADFELTLAAAWQPPDALLPRVDQIWAAEKQRRGDSLTNGPIFHLSDFRPDRLVASLAEYRYVLAGRRDPTLRERGLNLRPLAVTGLLECADGLVLGRRGSNVANDAGLWEVAPAGGLSHADPRGQLFEELEEEIGLSESEIVSAKACALVEDVPTGVLDILFAMRTALTGREVEAAHAKRASDEYAELAIVAMADLPRFLEAHKDRLIPALRPMLEAATPLS